MTIALIDYGAGNLRSVHNALVAAGAEGVAVTADPDIVAKADRIVLPGVGAFAACMNGLSAIDGLVEAIERRVRGEGAPFLGICVGMQLMASRGHEFGVTAGLGWIPGDVRRVEPTDPAAKIPHMGWNNLISLSGPPLVSEIGEAPMYFTHSFAFYPTDESDVAAYVDHGGKFPAAVAKGNVAGVQFHPEKSQSAGLALLARFLEWRP